MKLKQFQLTHVGLVREENQDSILTRPHNGIYLVADGMGGEKAGAEASAQVVETVDRISSDFFTAAAGISVKTLGEMVVNALEQASKDVFNISVREPAKAGLGSTGSLLCIQRGVYFVSQVGDSRVYLVRNGNVRQITRDHSIVWELYENGIINRNQLETHPERHLLTQCIGGSRPVEVDLYEDRVEVGDLYLVCSDGLTGYAGENMVISLLLEPGISLEERGKRLFEAAMKGGGGDNISVILTQVDALDESDNWTPDLSKVTRREGIPTGYGVTRPPAERGREDHRGDSGARNASNIYLAGGVLGFGLLAIVAALALKPGRVKSDVELVGLTDPAAIQQLEVSVSDDQGKPVPPQYVKVDGASIVFSAYPGKRFYVNYDAPGIFGGRIEVHPSSGAPAYMHPVSRAAQLVLDVDPAEITKLTITNLDLHSQVYAYDKTEGGDASIKLNHDLQPGSLHMVSVTNKANDIADEKIRIPEGKTENLAIHF